MSQKTKVKSANENKCQMQEVQMQRPPNSIKTIPLDGQNKGMPYYQQVYSDSRVPVLAEHLNLAMVERDCLLAEISKYKAEGRVANTTYKITCDKKKLPGVNYYRINLNDDFKHVCDEIGVFQGLFRVMLKAHIGKEFLDHLTLYLAEQYLGVSREEVMSKLNRAGDATDSVTTGIRTIRELILMLDDQVCENIPKFPSECYAQKIRQLASCMNLKEYEIFFVCFIGEIYTDARVYYELKANPEFADKLSQFQLDFLFAVELFCDYPLVLAHDATTFLFFLTEAQRRNDIALAVNTFSGGMMMYMSGDSLGKKTSASLDDRSCNVLEFCLEHGNGSDGVSAKAMMDHIKEESKSHFSKAILKPLRDLGYLRFANPDPHSCNQRYCVTPSGLTALRKARPGRTYPEPIRTDSDTVPAVPDGKTE